jgi:hypothetical protein
VNSDRLRSPDMRRSPDSFYLDGGVVAEAGETGGLGRPDVAGRELLKPVTELTKNDVDRTPPDRPVQERAPLVEQHLVAEPRRLHLGDQHHHVAVLVFLLEPTEVLDDRAGL